MWRTHKRLFIGVVVGLLLLVVIGIYFVVQTMLGFGSALYDMTQDQVTNTQFDEWLGEEAKEVLPPEVGVVMDGLADTFREPEEPLRDPFPTPAEPKPFLTASQKAALEVAGVDTSTIPDTLTPELEACFVSAIGAKRVEELKTGDNPSVVEFLSAKGCVGW